MSFATTAAFSCSAMEYFRPERASPRGRKRRNDDRHTDGHCHTDRDKVVNGRYGGYADRHADLPDFVDGFAVGHADLHPDALRGLGARRDVQGSE